MIEIKNLTKVYSTEKGVEFTAIENMNLNFDDKGMIFILGRSGCGKTTLLNLIGGLDEIHSGDILIDNKPINQFTSFELDYYRNSTVGFIFQEHNLLNHLNVKQNIEVALELQYKKIESDLIEKTLKKVDLEGFEKRKPKHLSTGQKQRVAIARSMVKNPSIILADEPTGALDEKTGFIIMDKLKEISKEKLVIVVTHDQGFAREYGDRIIKLEDGTVVSDETINSIAKKSEYTSTKPFKCKLPNKTILKIALSYLKAHPIRLFFTIFLTVIALSLFGFFGTLTTFNENKVLKNYIDYSDPKYIIYSKEALDSDGYYIRDFTSVNDIQYIKTKIPTNNLNYAFLIGTDVVQLWRIMGEIDNLGYSSYYYPNIEGGMEINHEMVKHYDFDIIAGNTPNNYNEIMITKYTYENFQRGGLIENNELISINSYEDLIGRTITIPYINGYDSGFTVVISGIIDTKLNSKRYEFTKVYSDDIYNFKNGLILDELNEIRKYGMHTLFYFKEGYYNDNTNSNFGESSKHPIIYVSVPYDTREGYLNEFVNFHKHRTNNDQIQYLMHNEITYRLYEIDDMFVFIYVITLSSSLVLIIISTILFYLFIHISINSSKKDIGLLRAIGTSKQDIFKIFIFKGSVIALSCFLLASLTTIIFTNFVANLYQFSLNLLNSLKLFGFKQIFILLVISVLLTFVSTWFPTKKLNKKRPIDLIKKQL